MHQVSLLVCSYTRKDKYLVLLLERLPGISYNSASSRCEMNTNNYNFFLLELQLKLYTLYSILIYYKNAAVTNYCALDNLKVTVKVIQCISDVQLKREIDFVVFPLQPCKLSYINMLMCD